MALRVLVSAGEVSGDQHLARVVRALRVKAPGVEIRGMAGAESSAAGMLLDVDCYRTGAAMGFVELVRSASGIIRSFRKMTELLKTWRPDVLLVVDYPDFNLRLAKRARRLGIKVVYFIPPKVWAWRVGRVRAIAACVDKIAAIFPFEPDFYRQHGYERVEFVGHPLAEVIPSASIDSPRDNSVLLLPGSRRHEVEKILVPMVKAFARLRPDFPGLEARVLLAPNLSEEWVRSLVKEAVSADVYQYIQWIHGEPLPAMQRARVGVLKSGTCNLEGAIAGLPFVCVYSGSRLAKMIISRLVPLTEYSPVNIIRSGTVRELMQVNLSDSDLASELRALLASEDVWRKAQSDLLMVRDSLRSGNERDKAAVSERVASIVTGLVSG
jgi:lipid-A-disaccharide synthase